MKPCTTLQMNKNQKAFQWLKDHRQFLKIYPIEKFCGINYSRIAKALQRGQTDFKGIEKICPFLDEFFPGWDN